jgi:hypothetical protein
MFSYESQREGNTFGRGDATRDRDFGALYCGAAAAKSSTPSDPQPPGAGSGHTDPPPDEP